MQDFAHWLDFTAQVVDSKTIDFGAGVAFKKAENILADGWFFRSSAGRHWNPGTLEIEQEPAGEILATASRYDGNTSASS
jgi:hypothetical protein